MSTNDGHYLTWGDLKRKIEEQGAKDDDQIDWMECDYPSLSVDGTRLYPIVVVSRKEQRICIIVA
jgi:hypothetical protein